MSLESIAKLTEEIAEHNKKTPTAYHTGQYWEERYKERRDDNGQCTSFEWYTNYKTLRPHIVPVLPKDARIMNLGCGSSTLSEDMYNDGYEHQVNVDISPTVIDSMRDKHAHMKGMTWEVADVRSMKQYATESFDAVVDKGTIDALSCGNARDCFETIKETHRLLKPGGQFLVTSSGPMERYLAGEIGGDVFKKQRISWESIRRENVTKDNKHCHYLHHCRKLGAHSDRTVKGPALEDDLDLDLVDLD